MKQKLNFLACAAIVATQWSIAADAQFVSDEPAASGAVYAMTNSSSENKILIYNRNSNGLLTFAGEVRTHGRGSGGIIDPLQSQGSLAFSQDSGFLFVANAGSGSIATFRVVPFGLDFVGETSSRGEGPISIAVHHHLLYVLNVESISGFHIQGDGSLTEIPTSTRYLATVAGRDLGASDIVFSPNGKFLAITERVSNQIVVFPMQSDGTAGAPAVNNSNGNTPFAEGFTPRGVLVTAEAAGAPGGGSAASSYSIADNGILQLISGSVPSRGAGACWAVLTRNGQFAFLTNAGSSNEALFSLSESGQLSFHSITSAGSNVTPLDTALTANDLFLYTLNGAAGSISEFRVDESSQSLTLLGTISVGLNANSGLQGLIAH